MHKLFLAFLIGIAAKSGHPEQKNTSGEVFLQFKAFAIVPKSLTLICIIIWQLSRLLMYRSTGSLHWGRKKWLSFRLPRRLQNRVKLPVN
jgi:hypothetical protein